MLRMLSARSGAATAVSPSADFGDKSPPYIEQGVVRSPLNTPPYLLDAKSTPLSPATTEGRFVYPDNLMGKTEPEVLGSLGTAAAGMSVGTFSDVNYAWKPFYGVTDASPYNEDYCVSPTDSG